MSKASETLTKLNEDLVVVVHLWKEVAHESKKLAWPKLGAGVDEGTSWQEHHSRLGAIRQKALDAERHGKKVDVQIEELYSLMRDGDSEIMANSALRTFLSAAIPERNYRIAEHCDSLGHLSEQSRGAGETTSSEAWDKAMKKIVTEAERGMVDAEQQLRQVEDARKTESHAVPVEEIPDDEDEDD